MANPAVTCPPGELMYSMMSLSGSSDSRNNSCAMMMLATSSFTGVPRNTMRSLSSREKMSQPRSPRWVCSMTVGMMKLLIGGRLGGLVGISVLRFRDRSLRNHQIKRLLLAHAPAEPGQRPLLVHLGLELVGGLVLRGRELCHPLFHVGVGHVQRLLV